MAAIAPDAERVDALPAVQAAILAARRLGRRLLVVGDQAGPEGSAREGIAALAHAGWAVTVTGGDAGVLGGMGVEVTDGDALSHVDRAPVLYDAVVLTVNDGLEELVPLLRRRQRLSVLASAGPRIQADGVENAVSLAPDRPDSWPVTLEGGLRAKVGLAEKAS